MKTVAVDQAQATLTLSMEELGLLMNALWQELGYQARRHDPIDDDLRRAYDELQRELGGAIALMGGRGPDGSTS